MDAASKVLGHRPALHGVHTNLLQRLRKPGDGSTEAPAQLVPRALPSEQLLAGTLTQGSHPTLLT